MARNKRVANGICIGLIRNFLILNFNMDFLTDLWDFLKERKKWWLAPLILVLLLVGILVVIGGTSAVAPFIYTLF